MLNILIWPSFLPSSNRKAPWPIFASISAFLLSACATLPTNAPTAKQVERSASAPKSKLKYDIVDVDATIAITSPTTGASGLIELEALSALATNDRTDLIRKGDTLTIRVFEVGVALFAGAPASLTGTENPVANAQILPVQVREDGTIELPYIGSFKAAGSYPDVLAQAIKVRLRPFSESPEVMIGITDTVANTVYVSGTVARSGRYRLTAARERLLDVIALAGGTNIPVDDAELRIARGQKVAEVPLSALRSEDLANIIVMPEDRIDIRRQSRSYTVFGATDRVSQVPFGTERVTLAEAVARVGGPSDNRANPRGIFLFRLERSKPGDPVRPVVYRLNLLRAESYFLAQMFQVQDKDVILFANADANLPGKFLGLLNQVFSPIVTAKVLSDNNN